MTINLLALDTSGKACSAALVQDGEIQQLIELVECQQAKQILSQIEQLLHVAGIHLNELDALAFACGPGSFTGIRLGASVIQGLAFGANLPVIPISTLQVIAQSAYVELDIQQAVVAMNAFGGKVYWGVYQLLETGQMMPVFPDSICSPQDVVLSNTENEDWIAVGDAWTVYKNLFTHCSDIPIISDHQYPQAKYVASLALIDFMTGKFVSAKEALPVYLYGAEQWKKQSSLVV